MKKVLIELKSIRKNPEAGNTHSKVAEVVKVKIKSRKPLVLPDRIDKDKIQFQQTFCRPDIFDATYEFRSDKEEVEFLEKWYAESKDSKYHEVSVFIEPIYAEHFPSPAYLFDYEKDFVECGNCHKMVEVSKIEIDWIYSDEEELDEMKLYTCPECTEVNTFEEIEFETIGSAVERLKNGKSD